MKKMNAVIRVLGMILIGAMLLVGCSGTDDGGNGNNTVNSSSNNSSTVYTVTLDPNGGTFPDGTTGEMTMEVREGDVIDFATYMASMEGNELRGWYQEDSSPWPGARKVMSDMKLKARWSVEVEKEVFPLVLELKGEQVPVSSDSGVYQFTVVSTIYSGYAQRSGLYTIYMDDLEAAIAADDGTAKRALLKVGSNYADSTGLLYAIMFNDGTMELYYDYEYQGARTIYEMDYVYWTLEDYTPPFAAEPEAAEEGLSSHAEYDQSLIAEEAPSDELEGEATDVVEFAGPSFISFDATNSETMKLQFSTNGTASIYMTTYEMNIETKYLWSYDEENGLVITYNGAPDNVVVLAEDGDTCTVKDGYDNTYEFSLSDFVNAIPERTEIMRVMASDSETMSAFFYDDNGVNLMYDLTSYGQEGQFYSTASGQWMIDEENNLQIAFGGVEIELSKNESGAYVFEADGNTYEILSSDLTK